jgi:hypothetical protein
MGISMLQAVAFDGTKLAPVTTYSWQLAQMLNWFF